MTNGTLSNHPYRIVTNGSERMRIDSSGNVGIGTPSPNMKLNISHADQDGLRFNCADGLETFIDFGDASDNDIGRISYDHADNHMAFRTNNAERMRINGDGNVGIGTTSPNDGDLTINVPKLHVVGPSTAGTYNLAARFQAGNDSNNTGSAILINHSNDRGLLIKAGRKDGDREVAYFDVISSGGNITNMLTMGKFASDYNVGIGTTGPLTKLDVRGSIFVSGYLAGFDTSPQGNYAYRLTNDGANSFINVLGGNLGIGVSSPASKLDINGGRIGIRNNIVAASNLTYSTIYSTENTGSAYPFTGTSGNLVVEPRNGQDFVVLGTSGVARMVVKGGGNVGIGTNSPQDKLNLHTSSASGNIGMKITRGTQTHGLRLGVNDSHAFLWTTEAQNLVFATSGIQRMSILSGGNVGIGDTSPDYRLSVAKVNAATPAIMVSGAFFGGPRIQTYGLDADADAWMGLGTDMGGAAYEHSIYFPNKTSTGQGVLTIGSYDGTTYSTKMTVLNDGNVGIGNTSPQTTLHTGPTTTITNVFTARFAASNFFASGGNSMFYVPDTAANIMMFGSNQFGTNQIEFYHKNPGTSQAYVGRISTSGSATSYVTSSDYRLKENIIPISDSISRLNQLKPSRFNFIEEPGKVVDGFIAHEVQDIVPEAIVGEKDEVDEEGGIIPQGIDQAKLVPLLVAAVQELEARVKELENK
jgi:hypothetical protein